MGIGGGNSDWKGVIGFDALFRVVATSSRRTLDVRCVHCPNLGEDEASLLQLTGLLQRDQLAQGAAILADWLMPSGVRLAMGPAQSFATALCRRNLWIAARRAHAPMPEQATLAVHHACTSTLIH
jgi:hypothetical protein